MPGTHLLQTLTKPNKMSLTLSYEDKRDLLTGMAYHRGSTLVAQRTYTYDALGRPLNRSTARSGQTVNDSFGYNNRSELTTATVNNGAYAYDYDNIGNRLSSQSSAGAEADAAITTYATNELNQYTALSVDGVPCFQPEYDADGNQCRVKTSTGIWTVIYDAENRPTDFTSVAADNTITTVHCEYDSMGRRSTKMVTVNGNVTLQQRYIYRGYLQIACIDLTRAAHPGLWLITWDPTQNIATRPLAIQKDGTWYTYGWDLTKNICEVYGPAGYLRTAYTYTPYGQVTANGDVEQPIQWSSEFNDTELGLIYYNYRHYNPVDGRWTGRDLIDENTRANLYDFVNQSPPMSFDALGLEDAPRICKKNYNAPRKCIAKISQEYCQYICECPKGYYWFDLGTGYEQLYRPCSEPDTITSGTCKAKKPSWLTSPKHQRQAKRVREYRFPANLPPHLAYRNASLQIMSLGIVIMLLYYGILSRA